MILGLERDECLPVLMNTRLFQPLYEIVKVDAGAHAERVMVRLMAAACTDMGALRNDVPACLQQGPLGGSRQARLGLALCMWPGAPRRKKLARVGGRGAVRCRARAHAGMG